MAKYGLEVRIKESFCPRWEGDGDMEVFEASRVNKVIKHLEDRIRLLEKENHALNNFKVRSTLRIGEFQN